MSDHQGDADGDLPPRRCLDHDAHEHQHGAQRRESWRARWRVGARVLDNRLGDDHGEDQRHKDDELDLLGLLLAELTMAPMAA